jgi:hypothetical protein
VKAAGRVLIDGADRGAAIAVGPRLAVTAHHVIGRRGDEAVVFRAADERPNPVTAFDASQELDAAVLLLSLRSTAGSLSRRRCRARRGKRSRRPAAPIRC